MRYLITGGSGYIGSRLVERLAAREDTERIVICDIRPPRLVLPRTEYHELDVRDAGRVSELMEAERPDALIHLAFVFNPSHDEHFMYEVDVNGCHNVLSAASSAGVQHVLVTSSAVAYGAFADNPVPITEEWPVRGVPGFEYARDKTESDRICQLWALEHPDRTMTIARPAIVFGPTVDNWILRVWLKQPFAADLGVDPGLQFVHEDDVVEALVTLVEGRHAGIFNVCSDDWMANRECAQIIGMRQRRIPFKVMERLTAATWRLRVGEAPPGFLPFAVHPWVLSNAKLKRETGWRPRYNSRETFEITMRTHGRLNGSG